WTHRAMRTGAIRETAGGGLYLGLIGHAFLGFVALNPLWSIPPWPLVGCLAVMTLATTATAAMVGTPLLHVLGIGAASAVIAGWTSATDWTPTALAAAAVLSVYALSLIGLALAGARP